MTEADLQVLRNARATCLAGVEANLAGADALAAVLARAETDAVPAPPVSEYVKAGTATVVLNVHKRTIIRRCKAGQGIKIGTPWYMIRSFVFPLDCLSSNTSRASIGKGITR